MKGSCDEGVSSHNRMLVVENVPDIYMAESANHMVRYGMVWYGMVWYGMVWYGVVWYGIV
jgi:hypothetical protein